MHALIYEGEQKSGLARILLTCNDSSCSSAEHLLIFSHNQPSLKYKGSNYTVIYRDTFYVGGSKCKKHCRFTVYIKHSYVWVGPGWLIPRGTNSIL